MRTASAASRQHRIEVSVWPKPCFSARPRAAKAWITSTGIAAPAVNRKRTDETSGGSRSKASSSALNMVGTPPRKLMRSRATARQTALGSKRGWSTTSPPAQSVGSDRIESPKEWKSGTTTSTRSSRPSPKKAPAFLQL